MGKRTIVGQKERVAAWVASRLGEGTAWGVYEAIGLEQDGELIAGVVFDGCVPQARCNMHVAGDGKRWLNREFLWFCFYYAFEQLGCNVVVGLVDADNEDALRFDKHLGFEETCRIEGGAGDCDLIVLTMQRRTCRWLGIRK